jgi:hypothetical protein
MAVKMAANTEICLGRAASFWNKNGKMEYGKKLVTPCFSIQIFYFKNTTERSLP